MGRALLAVGALLGLCFTILGVAVFVTREEDRVAVDQILAEEISRQLALADGKPDPVELDVVTDFEWDELVIVAEDTARDDIDAELGFEFKGDLTYDAESQDLFIFVRDGRLARFADYRGRLRFEGIERPFARLAPGDAVFRVRGGTVRPAAG
jgi:hypothetical protein